MTLIDYAVLAIYFATMIAIGIWAMRRVHNQEDYFMGGRGFGKLLQTFAAFGAGTGAHEPVTVGRTTWTSGLSGVWSAMMWLFVTPVYWITAVWYRRMRHLTLGDWFVERYQSQALGAAYTLFAIAFYMFYLSTMLSAIAKFAVPLIGVDVGLFGYELKYTLIPAIAVIVILYGVLGGLTAAYWTDLIQGLFIILLSILLIPNGLWAIAAKYGGDGEEGLMDGFRIMHERVSADYFQLFAGPSSGEFPVHYIISLSILALIGIVVQPHFIATGGGSAKTEDEARIGLVVGNFLKRLCTIGWALTALIALALLAGNPEIAADPDRVWGVAAREILGPLNMGLVGLMLACLLAAMMSSADTYMIVTSGLVVRNLYAPYINPSANERKYVLVGRLTGLLIIVGASAVALLISDVFTQFKLAMELPILFAAPFWVGMYWRRSNRIAAWGTIVFSLMFFFVLPQALPRLVPSLYESPGLAATTQVVTTTLRREATESDVARHQAWQTVRESQAAADSLGPPPPNAEVGEMITIVTTSGGAPIFWNGPLTAVEDVQLETVSESTRGEIHRRVQRQVGTQTGSGSLNLDFVLYSGLGFDLSGVSAATLETLRLPARVLLPFLVLGGLSLLTRKDEQRMLDRYFAKMNTPVLADPAADGARLEQAYENPPTTRKIFPESDWEFTWPTARDVIGFSLACAACAVIIGLLSWLAGLGGT
ncbi:sodium:solute symporter family protein [Allorhodopirellula heiligendammensis]|uniref:Sodium/glucose cotransporter n=1 Tax=Allorhodopirellula heiligendammensis TaxID=2714739 RepID=A0A5C6BW12_9BACT|nr:sodium:solute symporter family protein [Allorhodopirellula heiligendammensis]TWU16082.1 Sodium/glucose cotransporter [Allorhodopirellula heiligendammensis]